MVPSTLRSIAIEGVIGAGKTSLSTFLAEEWKGQLVLEEPHKNPFLEDFYQDPRHWAFQVQLTFLFARYNQMIRATQMTLFESVLVSDYLFDKDRIFASLNLDDRELALYDKVASSLEREVPTPDLVVYLQAGVDRLMQHIRVRNRSYERNMDRQYIKQLNEAYNQYFRNYKRSPLLIVNSNEIDFVNSPEHRRGLIRRLEQPVVGTMYYNPGV